jgi:hypothetical protein
LIHHQSSHFEIHEKECSYKDDHIKTVDCHCENIQSLELNYANVEQQEWDHDCKEGN